MTPDQIAALREKAQKAKDDWPAIATAITDAFLFQQMHGLTYSGPSFNLEALIDAQLSLLSDLARLQEENEKLRDAVRTALDAHPQSLWANSSDYHRLRAALEAQP